MPGYFFILFAVYFPFIPSRDFFMGFLSFPGAMQYVFFFFFFLETINFTGHCLLTRLIFLYSGPSSSFPI